jgi:hypothetical protein
VWRDYGNPRFPELTQYLDALATEVSLHYIEEAILAFRLVGLEALGE